MNNQSETITKLHLKSFGLTEYLIQQILKDLEGTQSSQNFKEYAVKEVKSSIEARLLNKNIRPTSREKYCKALALLDHQQNVIEVDFLKKLSHEKRIEFFENRLKSLFEQEKVLRDETNNLLNQAQRMLIRK